MAADGEEMTFASRGGKYANILFSERKKRQERDKAATLSRKVKMPNTKSIWILSIESVLVE